MSYLQPLFPHIDRVDSHVHGGGKFEHDDEFQQMCKDIDEAQNEGKFNENINVLFNGEKSMRTIEKYFYLKVKHIEAKIPNIEETDMKTMKRIQTSILQLYEGMMRVYYGKLLFNIHLPCSFGTSHIGYTESGVVYPLKINALQMICDANRLLSYIVIILMFYDGFVEILLDPSADESSNAVLRGIYYLLIRLMKCYKNNKDNLSAEKFGHYMDSIFLLLEIDLNSRIFHLISHEFQLEAAGDFQIINTSNQDCQNFNNPVGKLRSLSEFKSNVHKVVVGPKQ